MLIPESNVKLYYSPGACSLSVHIVLHELGLAHDTVKVDLKSHTTADGADYYAINPKGYVPALQLDGGRLLTEVPAVLQYLADLKPDAGLLPAAGTVERAEVQGWLGFAGTELHKNFSPFFNPAASPDWKAAAGANLEKRLGYVNGVLADRQYLTGDHYCVADAYLFVLLNWCGRVGIDLSRLQNLAAFHQRVGQRPAVQQAMRAEGLIKD